MRYIIIVLLSIFFSYSGSSQTLNKKTSKIYKKIYNSVLENYFDSTAASFVLIDSTVNREILETDFLEYSNTVDQIKELVASDAEWLLLFKEIKNSDSSFKKIPLPKLSSNYKIELTTQDSLNAVFKSYKIPWTAFKLKFNSANGWMEFSNIFLSQKRDRAILELNHVWGSENGIGKIFFLKKNRRNKWIVVYSFITTMV